MIKKCTVLLTVLFRYQHNTGAAEAIEDWVSTQTITYSQKNRCAKLEFFLLVLEIFVSQMRFYKRSLYVIYHTLVTSAEHSIFVLFLLRVLFKNFSEFPIKCTGLSKFSGPEKLCVPYG